MTSAVLENYSTKTTSHRSETSTTRRELQNVLCSMCKVWHNCITSITVKTAVTGQLNLMKNFVWLSTIPQSLWPLFQRVWKQQHRIFTVKTKLMTGVPDSEEMTRCCVINLPWYDGLSRWWLNKSIQDLLQCWDILHQQLVKKQNVWICGSENFHSMP